MDSVFHYAVQMRELQRREGRARVVYMRAGAREMHGLEEPSTLNYEVMRDDDSEHLHETAGLRLSVRPQLCSRK